MIASVLQGLTRVPDALAYDLFMTERNAARSLFTRRSFLLSGALALTGSRFTSATPSCALVPEQAEGPYYIDHEKLRRNITEGKPGVPLLLRIGLVDAKRCSPVENAALDIWHCDAEGVYSGFAAYGGGQDGLGRGGRSRVGPVFGARGPGGPFGRGGPQQERVTDDSRFLRGIQLTNGQGLVEFQTLYPGWYAGRTIHIHIKVHLGGAVMDDQYTGGHVSHTGQLFFPEDITEQISKMEPYANRSGVHRTLHSEDHIFLSQGGSQSMVSLERLSRGSNAGGFLAAITLAVDPDATPQRR
jgi:protocatechuate 3,4-dioxygenase beta subunit